MISRESGWCFTSIPKTEQPAARSRRIISSLTLPKYEQNRAAIVGVSVDSTGSHQEFCAEQGLTFKLLADAQKSVSRQYGSLTSLLGYKISSRNTFLVNPEGRIAKVLTGVDPGRHSAEVLAALTQIAR